jgi:predicted ATPase with chaperone activity
VTQLVVKLLHAGSDRSGLELASRLGLEFSVIEPVLDALKHSHQVERFGGAIGGPSYRYRITDEGRRRAQLFLERSQYIGAAPVPLEQYKSYMRALEIAAPRRVSPSRIRAAFSHLVLHDHVLNQVGTAAAAGHSMFVYGPPGNGKTVIAQALRNVLEGDIAIPHALEVEGEIIRLFDPVNHEPVAEESTASELVVGTRPDRRWVRCRRPLVTVGGELTLESLDLAYSPAAGFYSAPLQAIANGGVLVIDDFGRQHCSPRDMLNRWIVPLESRIDYLRLHTGQKFDLPFMVMVVFATNLKPGDLVDEAFLRRVQFKILAENPTREDFFAIFENYCREQRLQFDPAAVRHVLDNYMRPRGIALRGCQPRDLIGQALAYADYMGMRRELTTELLEVACTTYFVQEDEAAQ